MSFESALLCPMPGLPRFRSGGFAVALLEGDSGESGDSSMVMGGDRFGESASCGASPQTEGVLDVAWVFGEK